MVNQGVIPQTLMPQYAASQNPVLPVANNQQNQAQTYDPGDGITRALCVEGFEGARACKLPPNCTFTIAYDKKLPMVYFIYIIDGERHVTGFDTKEHPEPKPVTTEQLNETLQAINRRLQNLEEDYNGLNSRLGQENGQQADASGKQRSNESNQGNAGRH